jgi:hypothetical protein
MNTTKFLQHPLSASFPAMKSEEYVALMDSINVNGVLNPITILDGLVIDGWHRYNAANELGMACPTVEMDLSIDPIDFVRAQNENRRHLTASQRAAAIVSIYQWVPTGANQHAKGGVEPGSYPPKTNGELAAIAKVSTKTIQQAKVAQKAGLTEAVKDGAITVKEAAQIASGKSLILSEACAPEDIGPDAAEMEANALAASEDAKFLAELLAADDKLALSVSEVKRLNAVNAHLQIRVYGLMNEKNEAIRAAKSLERQVQFLRKGASK